jgi:prepilin peptidase CpaA
MLIARNIALAVMFVPLAITIVRADVRYRRIPNKLVLLILIGGLGLNTVFDGWKGLLASVGGCAVTLVLMLMLYVFGAMGAGDVKLLAAAGSVVGVAHVLPMLMIVALSGGVFALVKMIYVGRVKATMINVFQFFYGFLSGQIAPRVPAAADRVNTLPYALPICFGSLLSLFLFNA